MNTILTVMSDAQIVYTLAPICVIIAIVAIYRTAVSNRKEEKH